MDHQASADRGEPPRIAIVIVTYNSSDVLKDCLLSVVASTGVRLVRVVVADNASRDDSIAVAESMPDLPIRAVSVGSNAGYAAGVNVGIAAVDLDEVDGVFVLNPDCRLRPDSLARLAAPLTGAGRGLVVPKLVNPDGSLQPSLRRPPTIARALAEAVLGGRATGRLGSLGELITDPDSYARPGTVAWATGAALLVSPEVIREIGPWDESYLHYSEEADYALRCGDRGWSPWYEPASVVEHIGGESAVNPTLFALLTINRVRLFRKRSSRPAAGVYYLCVLFGEAVRALAGRRISRVAVAALVLPSRRPRALPG